MAIELKIPSVGESITEVEIGDWLKSPGDIVQKDEPLVSLESEKATVELPAPEAGKLTKLLKQKGEMAKVGETIAYIERNGQMQPKSAQPAKTQRPDPPTEPAKTKPPAAAKSAPPVVMPAAERELAEHGLKPEDVEGTGPGGRILKEDVLRAAAAPKQAPSEARKSEPAQEPPRSISEAPPATAASPVERQEEVVPMSRLRRTVAERLVEAQNAAALLTTFNEIDMGNVLALRKEHGDAFQTRYGVKLGFMSFFVKASIDALKQFPAVNAEIRGTNIVYHNYFDIGIAVGSGKGLVVPVLRNAERLSFSEVEIAVGDFGRRAKENKLKVEELQGGTFTISNGGVYGSLLSTPIVNPPQSGVLGMHAIQERPVAREGNVVIRPMMYVALTYDHRLVDGREAVSFLKRVKDAIENPARMLLEV
ncbi:MAG TPA: 2-oxoglutarate dehydrogenase complex dihydrolipoyllysine-residue succinyltransferase [Candidatus Dormibacteraeota bacterium]|nr:2-oxoglutarate dehydrogenase complex dihydrolipoyllysine-residue succinyltransferase [Candidatus Dormibacteraeota bacterium]